MVIGHTAQLSTGGESGEFQVLGLGGPDSLMLLARFGDDGNAPAFKFAKSRGSSVGSYRVLRDDDGLGFLDWMADDDADIDTVAARIRADVDDASPASGDIGGAILIQTAPGGGGGGVATGIELQADGGVFMARLATGTGNAINISSDELVENTSSIEFKESVRDLEIDSEKIYKLLPKTFRWKSDATVADSVAGLEDFGLIAEEVAKEMPELVHYRKPRRRVDTTHPDTGVVTSKYEEFGTEKPFSVKYTMLGVVLLSEIQKLRGRIVALEAA